MARAETLDLFVVGFGRPDLLRHQHRLLSKHLTDDHSLTVVDNSHERDAAEMEAVAEELKIGYCHAPSPKHLHNEALNFAARLAAAATAGYWGFIDHDVFPRSAVSLIDKIDEAGFYGIGQRHAPSQVRYLFPGFCFFSRAWVRGRTLNFDGIRGDVKRDDGDCGSMLHSLFTEDDWWAMHRGEHGYGTIRPEDGVGLQSWGFEVFDAAWVHLTNASSWMAVPNPGERERLLREMIEAL